MRTILTYFCFWLLLCGCRSDPAEEGQQRIDAILSRTDAHDNVWSARIQDVDGATTYYERAANDLLVPASTTKLYTTSVAFAKLGPSYRFQTHIYVTGFVTNGNLDGNIVLLNAHDFTWSKHFYENPRRPLDEMAQRCYALGLRSIAGDIVAQGECLFNGRLSNELVANEFKNALNDAGIIATGASVGKEGLSPSGDVYTSWESLPLEHSVRVINQESVNLYANLLLKHVGLRIAGIESPEAGAKVTFTWLESIGVNTAGMVMEDGSGLSRNNRITTGQTVRLLRFMHKNYPTYAETLSIGCANGTLAERFCDLSGTHTIYGKTGTLPGVVALSGFVSNRLDGQVFVFSVIANSVKDRDETRDVIDHTVLATTQFPTSKPAN